MELEPDNRTLAEYMTLLWACATCYSKFTLGRACMNGLDSVTCPQCGGMEIYPAFRTVMVTEVHQAHGCTIH